jgi:hypothetical protein
MLSFDRPPEKMPLRFFPLLSATPPAIPSSAAPPASAGAFAFSASFTRVERLSVAALPRLLLAARLELALRLLEAFVFRVEREAALRGLLVRPLLERLEREPEVFALELERSDVPVPRFDPPAERLD